MTELLKFPSNTEFYFTAIFFVVTLMLEEKIKEYIKKSKGNISKLITLYPSITVLVLISGFLYLITDFCIFIFPYIFKSNENGNMIFYLFGAVLFSFYHLLSLNSTEQENKEEKAENCKVKVLFCNVTNDVITFFRLYPKILLCGAIIFITIGFYCNWFS